MPHALSERLSTCAAGLSPTEQRLARLLMEERDFCAFGSVGEIAARVQAHASALVRLARKLGYTGFPELRSDIQADILGRSKTDELVRRRLEDSRGKTMLERLVERDIAALSQVPQLVSQSDLDAAAKTVLTAPHVFILAEGTAEALARHAAHRLRRAGIMTLQLQPDPRSVAEGAGLIRAGDAAIGFGLREIPALVQTLFAQTRAAHGRTVLISDLSGMMLRPTPDHLLAASRGSDLESGTLTVPMALLNALILTVADKGAPATLDSYRTYSDLRDLRR